MFMFQFVFIFHIIFMFHEHIYTYCISYIFPVSCLLHMEFHILYLEIGIIPIESSKLKLCHFHAKLVILPVLHSGQFEIPIFQCLESIFDTGFLYSFKAKVLRVLLQLESPKSEHRYSRYVLNNRDYSMFKN